MIRHESRGEVGEDREMNYKLHKRRRKGEDQFAAGCGVDGRCRRGRGSKEGRHNNQKREVIEFSSRIRRIVE